VEAYFQLTSLLVEGEWSASHPGRFTSEERISSVHWRGGWIDPRAGHNDTEERQTSQSGRKFSDFSGN
jgi:hypothetical protein